MQFTSPIYYIFLALVVLTYYLSPDKIRWAVLLIASYIFYAYWNLWVISILIFSTFISFFSGLLISQTLSLIKRKQIAVTGVVLNLSLLFIFKYYVFTANSISLLIGSTSLPIFNIILPIGISFFILQAISYIIDVYRQDAQPEVHLGYFALYMSFFPQLLAGPIERVKRFLPQLKKNNSLSSESVICGFKYILVGLFKKIVLADNLAIFSDYTFSNYPELSSLTILIGVYFYSFQIYFDFSGYVDIAKGTA